MLRADDSVPVLYHRIASPPCDCNLDEADTHRMKVTAYDSGARGVVEVGKTTRKIGVRNCPAPPHEPMQQPAYRAANPALHTPRQTGDTARRIQEASQEDSPEHRAYPPGRVADVPPATQWRARLRRHRNGGSFGYRIAGPRIPDSGTAQQAPAHRWWPGCAAPTRVLMARPRRVLVVSPAHFPIQKLEKIRASRSSVANAPVISPSASCASRSSSATSSPALSTTSRPCARPSAASARSSAST